MNTKPKLVLINTPLTLVAFVNKYLNDDFYHPTVLGILNLVNEKMSGLFQGDISDLDIVKDIKYYIDDWCELEIIEGKTIPFSDFYKTDTLFYSLIYKFVEEYIKSCLEFLVENNLIYSTLFIENIDREVIGIKEELK